LRWRKKDLLQTDYRSADIIYCFLNIPTMAKLARRLSEHGRPNGLLISYIFPLPGHEPVKTLVINQEKIYFYRLTN